MKTKLILSFLILTMLISPAIADPNDCNCLFDFADFEKMLIPSNSINDVNVYYSHKMASLDYTNKWWLLPYIYKPVNGETNPCFPGGVPYEVMATFVNIKGCWTKWPLDWQNQYPMPNGSFILKAMPNMPPGFWSTHPDSIYPQNGLYYVVDLGMDEYGTVLKIHGFYARNDSHTWLGLFFFKKVNFHCAFKMIDDAWHCTMIGGAGGGSAWIKPEGYRF